MKKLVLKVTDDMMKNADLFMEVDRIAEIREMFASEFRPSIEVHEMAKRPFHTGRTLAEVLGVLGAAEGRPTILH